MGDHHRHHRAGGPARRLRHRLGELAGGHRHDAAGSVDRALKTGREGSRALAVSLAVLVATAAAEAAVVAVSGSIALLGDALHNLADAFTAVPLLIAFSLGRRPPTRRYTYGFGRSEDLAGVVIVGLIAASSAAAAVAAVGRIGSPPEVRHLWAVAAAGLVGFAGNELVARYRIRVGRRIGSAALVADGVHARADGLTSLAVLAGAGGVALGWRLADPVVGLLIAVAILGVLRTAAREVYRRLMDAVDPVLVDQAVAALGSVDGVRAVGEVRLRWIGHRLRAECAVVVDRELSLVAAHHVALEAEHRLLHDVPRLTAALVHADPVPTGIDGAAGDHALIEHHRPARG